jgi:RNA polymerase sigma-70 factor (ECF subfamily)
MSKTAEPDTEDLLDLVAQGDRQARNRLLDRHRKRLRELIALRMDRRLLPRVDPSDVVQDSLIEADRRLAEFVEDRPVPFYVWLRQLALERLIEQHRRHIRAKKRSVKREEGVVSMLPDESLQKLAERLAANGSSPSAQLQHEDQQHQLTQALGQLKESDRELLVLRHLEHLSVKEIASVLGITEGAVKVRHVRALERLRRALGSQSAEDNP